MKSHFGKLFHNKSKDRETNGRKLIPEDKAQWPASWKTVEYKEYALSKKIKLPEPVAKTFNQSNLLGRRTFRKFARNQPVGLQDLSNILYFACGETGFSNEMGIRTRFQPSGGARYPLEVYVLNMQPGEIVAGCYHYDVRTHSLEELWPFDASLSQYFTYSWSTNASFSIMITALPDRSVRKYGERGYRYIYLEAGVVAGYLLHSALINGWESAMLGGTDDEKIEELLDINIDSETLITGVVFGKA